MENVLVTKQKRYGAYTEGRRGGYRILKKDVEKYIRQKLRGK